MCVSLVVKSSCLVSENLGSALFQFAFFCIVLSKLIPIYLRAIKLGYVVVYKQTTNRAVVRKILGKKGFEKPF